MTEYDDPDGQVDEFLELERELTTGRRTAGTYDEGTIAEAARPPASEVPDDYPVEIRTARALQLNVEVPDGETVTTYLEWPGDGEDSDHVERLLDALGRDREEFANVYGDPVALDAEDGWHRIDVRKTAARRGAQRANADDSLDLTRNLLVAAVAAGALGFAFVNTLLDSLGHFLVFVAWAAIPAATYFDATRIEAATDWSPGTTRWILGGLVPVLNVSVAVAYLVDRHVRLSGTTSGDVSEIWFEALVASMLTFPAALAVDFVSTDAATVVFAYGWLFMPFAVYFDAEYVEDATDWDPNKELWAVVAFLTWILGTGAYLLRRWRALD